MITCRDDRITIQFPCVDETFRGCAARYIDEWLPRVVAEDVLTVLDELFAQEFSWLSDDERHSARAAVTVAAPERTAERFREMVAKRVERCRARTVIGFERTLRLPDDGKVYPLPIGLDRFPIRRIEPFLDRFPAAWQERGGILMPMYQAEALWLFFDTHYPFALKVGTGMDNAVTGQPWADGLSHAPQGYVVLPEQPWLDGYCVGEGVVRQFVAARLGDGYTVEEQLGTAPHGGLQLEAFPLKPEVFFEKQFKDELPRTAKEVVRDFLATTFRRPRGIKYRMRVEDSGMGLGAGGRMKQEIYADPWAPGDWDTSAPARVWVHLCDAVNWFRITGELPPQEPVTAKEYAEFGLPWFDYYREDMDVLQGSPEFAKVQSVFSLAQQKGDSTVPQEAPLPALPVVAIGPHAPEHTVTEWDGK